MVARKTGRNSIGVEIEPEYCRMTARYLKAARPAVASAKAEEPGIAAPARLQFEKATVTEKACMVAEDKALYTVHPARKRLN